MKLMIVESPNKIKKIKSILNARGNTWEVAASVGHIRDLPVKDLGITTPGYTPQYELTERGRDVLKRLKPLAARADEVYLATDPDREGEAISWHLKEALRLRAYHRVAFDAITPAVIARALERPRPINDHLVQAQEARRVLDRLVGYQVSPVLSRQTARRGLSAGRVQSPAVRLVVDREREIEAFRETKHFGAEVSFDHNAWRAQWETTPWLPKGEKYLLDKSLAERAALCRAFTVTASDNKRATQPPPPPFTTSTLLQAASVTLGLKPDITAQLAQKLFEQGLITYHRTDSQNFSAEAIKEVRAFAAARKLPLPASPRHWKSRGGAQEAHEAIRPTHLPTEGAGEDRLQQSVYRLIWTRAVASQLADAEYSVNTLRLTAQGDVGLGPDLKDQPSPAQIPGSNLRLDPVPGSSSGSSTGPSSGPGNKRFTFKAVGRTLLAPGWKALTARDDAEEDEPLRDGEDNCGRVPLLPANSLAQAETGRVLFKQTRPPSRYTQASLIKKLESIGIGRPSTYPAILKNVLTRGYLGEAAKFLTPTDLGCLVVDTLEPRFRFLDYAFTRDLEQQLDDIAEGKASYLDVVSKADAQLQQELANLGAPASTIGRPQHSPSATRRKTPLPPIEANPDLPASGERRATAAASRRAAASRAPAAERPSRTRRSANPTSPAGERSKRARAASAPQSAPQSELTALPTTPSLTRQTAKNSKTRAATPRAGQKPSPAAALVCPKCRAGMLRLSRDEKFYGCSRYSEGCAFAINTIIAGRKTKPADLAALSKSGRTEKLTGFLSKTGRPFEAALVLADSGRIEFAFTPR